jgi:hypothetical protein
MSVRAVDAQHYGPIRRAPALFGIWSDIPRAKNLLVRRNLSFGNRSMAALPPNRTVVNRGQEDVRREIVLCALLGPGVHCLLFALDDQPDDSAQLTHGSVSFKGASELTKINR